MSINATTSSVSSSTQVSGAGNSVSAKTTGDSSFKEEMDKVSSEKSTDKKVEKSSKEDANQKEVTADSKKESQMHSNNDDNKQSLTLNNSDEDLKYASLNMNNANSMLTNDIQQMMLNSIEMNSISGVNSLAFLSDVDKTSNMFTLDFKNSVSLSQSDAEFFIDLAQNGDVSAKAIVAQAQAAFDNGVEFSQIQQNVKISETLLNAINTARENNQPLRIDFDQNVAVILRIGKDGSFAANFIPGDKVVEQYLKNNIESLKATFDEQDLPYSDLSYSNRGSKQQKEQRKNQQQ